MENKISNNKRIAKNTAFLYMRMLIILFISFFTSRVILQSLGVVDYGIYNVVGGVVAMFSFFNAALSGATGRFLSYEIGVGNKEKLRKTFQTALTIHILIGLLIVVLIETIGLWYVKNKLNVPIDRLDSAVIVFHISALTCFLNIIQVPFNASITSHEKMSAFAYISILDALMKLSIAYLLYMFCGDRLILYAILLMSSIIIVNFIYIVYCKKKFKECSFSFQIDKSIMLPMLKFSGWDLYGNLSVMVRSQGLNILQNYFFGPIVNASTAVANTVLNAIMGFTDNFLIAVRPQIVKQYATQQYESFQKLVFNSSRYSYFLLLLTTLPLLIEAQYVMELWLKEVPQYAVVFCQLSIINNWISILFRSVVISVNATGQVKQISLINGTIYILVLPISYIMLKQGYGPTLPFILNIIFLFIGHTFFTMFIVVKRIMPFFKIGSFFKGVLFKCLIVTLMSIPIPILFHILMSDGFFRFIIVGFISLLWAAFVIYYFGIEGEDRKHLHQFIISKYQSSFKKY